MCVQRERERCLRCVRKRVRQTDRQNPFEADAEIKTGKCFYLFFHTLNYHFCLFLSHTLIEYTHIKMENNIHADAALIRL